MIGSKKYLFKQIFKEARPKKIQTFRISKDIGQGAFQLELSEEWMIHNVLNKDLLMRCKEL